MSQKALLEVGYVSRAHGIRGEIAVKPFDPDSEALLQVERISVAARLGEPKPYRIVQARKAAKEVLLVLEGVAGRTEAEALKGATVSAFREDLPPPEGDEFFQGDLLGLAVVNEAGEALGKVEEIWETGPVPNLVIRGEGGELIVPFADEFIPEVDLEAGRLVVRPPELLE